MYLYIKSDVLGLALFLQANYLMIVPTGYEFVPRGANKLMYFGASEVLADDKYIPFSEG